MAALEQYKQAVINPHNLATTIPILVLVPIFLNPLVEQIDFTRKIKSKC